MTDVSMTPMETLLNVYDIARQTGILYTYLGNVSHGEYENTYCPSCGNICIERKGFYVDFVGLESGKCIKCDSHISIVTDKYKK